MFSPLAAVTLALALLAEAPLAAGPVQPVVAATAGDELRHAGPTPPPHGYPQIETVSLSATTVRAGSRVYGNVVTSANVGYVEARIENYNIAMHADAPGHFSLAYTVPWWLPPWLRHAYTLQIIARSIDGVEAIRPIGIRVR